MRRAARLRTAALVLAAALTAALTAAAVPGAAATGRAVRVRVLVITMILGETAPWLDHEVLPLHIEVPGAFAPLRCNRAGLCVATVGVGKANAGTSVTAILDSPRLDLRRAYFLTAGIAGTPPDAGTLGFAAWARWVVDWDLGHHLLPHTAPQVPHGYLPGEDTGTNVYRLNDRLVDAAYRLTKDLPLTDSAQAAEARSHYPGQVGRHPFVARCDTLTGDDFWAGRELSATARYITALRTGGRGRYCTAQQEDNATAAALARHGYLGRYLVLRTASDFDQPYPGQSLPELLASFPGYQPAVDNAYLVGSAVAHRLLAVPQRPRSAAEGKRSPGAAQAGESGTAGSIPTAGDLAGGGARPKQSMAPAGSAVQCRGREVLRRPIAYPVAGPASPRRSIAVRGYRPPNRRRAAAAVPGRGVRGTGQAGRFAQHVTARPAPGEHLSCRAVPRSGHR